MSGDNSTYKRLFRETPVMLAIIGLDGFIREVNPYWQEFTGFSEAELTGKPWMDFVHPDDVPALQAAQRLLMEGSRLAQVEGRVICRDGGHKWVLISGTLDAENSLLWTSASDITARRKAEEDCRSNEHLLRRIIDKAPISMAIVGMDERIEYINRKAEETFGFPNSEIPTMKDWWEKAYPDEAYRGEVISDWMGRVMDGIKRNGEILGNEYRVTCKDGSEKVCHIFGVIAAGKVFVMFDNITERVKAQEAVSKSEETLRQILESAPVPIVLHDLESTHFVNHAFTDTFGYSLDEIPTLKGWTELAYPDEAYRKGLLERFLSMHENAKKGSGDLGSIECHITCKGGTVKTARITTQILADGKMVASVEDLTDILTAKQLLRENARTLRRVLEQAPVAMVMHSLDGKFLIFNKKLQQITGYTLNDVPDLDAWARRAYPDDNYRAELLRFWTEQMERSLRTGQEMDPKEVRLVRKDGSVMQANVTGIVTPDKNVIGLMEDITGRRETERALRESESLYRSLVETTRTGYVVIDGHGKVLDANREYVWLSGHSDLKEILGRSVLDWAAPHEKERSREAVSRTVRDGYISGFEVDHQGKNGKVTPVEINATVVIRDGVPQIVALCRDITTRRQRSEKLKTFSEQMENLVAERTTELQKTNEELTMEIAQRMDAERSREKLQQELLHSQKMELVGRLAGGVTHDFNNILVAISGYAEMLLKDLPEGSQARQDAQDIMHETERGTLLTRQLGGLSRKKQPSPKPLELNAVISDSLRMLKKLLTPSEKLSSSLSSGLPLIVADEGQISQVIMNLVVNARDAMPDGGEVRIATAIEDLKAIPAGMQLAPAPGRYVVLSVEDTGTGIPADLLPRVFEPFFTSKEEGKGTGLGLSIIYGIMNRLGGGISLETKPGGTTFKMYFPAAEGS